MLRPSVVLLAALGLSSCTRSRSVVPDAGVSESGCVDAWLEERRLDPYGSPQGTMYAGGTPLMNEATGEMKDRLEYVYARHPEARAACRR